MFFAFFSELREEAGDFFEDLFEHVYTRKGRQSIKEREISLGGVTTKVRPAYLFAERIDNSLRVLFGVSMILSAFTASFLGYSTLSELLKVLISTVPGRILMFMIGLSYFLIAIWKLLHLHVPSHK